jgi:type III secretory pathway component EscS
MALLLTVLTALAVLALVAVLVGYLIRIIQALERIGGTPTSLLAKIRLGVRAIEQQTAALGPEVARLNEGLTAIAGGLRAVDDNLAGTVASVAKQGG